MTHALGYVIYRDLDYGCNQWTRQYPEAIHVSGWRSAQFTRNIAPQTIPPLESLSLILLILVHGPDEARWYVLSQREIC